MQCRTAVTMLQLSAVAANYSLASSFGIDSLGRQHGDRQCDCRHHRVTLREMPLLVAVVPEGLGNSAQILATELAISRQTSLNPNAICILGRPPHNLCPRGPSSND